MKNDTKRNNVIIGTLLITIALMIIGFISLNNQLRGNNSIKQKKDNSNWDTSILSVEKSEELSTGNTKELAKPEFAGSAFTFHVSLPSSSKIVYDVKIKNKGNIDSKFKSILGSNVFNQLDPTVVTCEVEKLDQEDTLIAGAIHTFRVTISRNYISDEILKKGGTIYFEYK